MTLYSGGEYKMTGSRITYSWPLEGGYIDRRRLDEINGWLRKNDKALSKKSHDAVVREMAEQFPWLAVAECSGTGMSARYES